MHTTKNKPHHVLARNIQIVTKFGHNLTKFSQIVTQISHFVIRFSHAFGESQCHHTEKQL